MKSGDEFSLNCQLWDGAEDKYVKAYLYDETGTQVTNSPVNLAHTANGLYQYKDSSLVFPASIDFVTATYIVFTDVGYSSESGEHARSQDIFKLDDLVDEVELIKQIETGRWRVINNQMIFYEDDNTTEVARFNLYDSGGNPAVDNVFERQRV